MLDNYRYMQEEIKDISIKEIWNDIKRHSRLFLIVLPFSFVLSYLYMLGKPDMYLCTIKLSPELGGKQETKLDFSLLSALTSGKSELSETEALFPMLYPSITKSNDFKLGLLSIKFNYDGKDMTYYDYLLNYQKRPWWKSFNSLETYEKEEKINAFRLSEKQDALMVSLNGRIICTFDKLTWIITLGTYDQDPEICAILADSVASHLQKFITEYHTKKSRETLLYYEKILKQAKKRYEDSKYRYTEFCDKNRDANTLDILTKQEQLENEMNIDYKSYSSNYLEKIKVEEKIQEDVPAFAIIQKATVPNQKDQPHRLTSSLFFVFFVFLCLLSYSLYKEDDLMRFLGISNIK